MTETDLQLGGGYTYQWECAILLALNYFFEPVRYNPVLFDLIGGFLGRVDEIHLEGEDRESGIDLEDINLINDNRRILIQVKTKQAEGQRWTLSDPLLLKALYKFSDSRFLASQPESTRFVFLTNRPFNPDLVEVKAAIKESDVAACAEAERLGEYLDRYARGTGEDPVDVNRFRAMLAHTRFVEYLAVDEVKANIQAKLQALGRDDWEAAHAVVFEHFARRSTRVEGATVTRPSLIELLGPAAKPPPSYPPTPATRPTVPTEGEPLALLAAALEARRFLLVWADVPFPPEERPSIPRALLINRWQEAALGLPGTPFDFAHGRPWPLATLPPLTILSLDPSNRLERAFRYAGAPLEVVRSQADLPDRERHNLLKLGGDLDSRTGLLLDWDAVRKASSDAHKAHLLREARRAAQDGAVLVLEPSPGDAVARIWRELVAPAVRGAKHCFILGPTELTWPEPLTKLDGEVEDVFRALADTVIPPPLELAETESLRRQLREARQNLRLIKERTSEYVMSTDVPLQLTKEERRLREHIAELERRLSLGSDGGTHRE